MRDIQKLSEDAIKQRKKFLENFQKDDFNLLEDDRAIFDWACKQTYIPLTNMITAAASLGIDSVPIEGFNRKAVDDLLIKEKIIDPVHFGVSVMVGFGYGSKSTHYEKTRQKANDVIKWY